jgi:hypothetical protein
MRKNRKSWSKGKRIEGQFVILPYDVLCSEAYRSLSYTARSLLLEFCLQYRGFNNGMLLATMRHLKKRGWNSADVVTRAKRELIEADLIFETVKGRRPSIASWYALTWNTLDQNTKYDTGSIKGFRRGMYRDFCIGKDGAIPASGIENPVTKPDHGATRSVNIPVIGAVKG